MLGVRNGRMVHFIYLSLVIPSEDSHTAYNQVDISLVIVNYNVKEFLSNLLVSIDKARAGLKLEIFVVDNNSSDGSIPYLKQRFPEISYIENRENIGFGKANNQAIFRAKGKYTLLINPDTLIEEDTLRILYEHMENHPQTGACGCKILNPDGSFADESRRTVPTPWTALGKVLGLSNLFPKSKFFAGYYMNWLDENTASQVPVISGSFMFFRSDVLKELGGFDEQFFMYGEDVDVCYRLTKGGWHIDYVPQTSIIHYKGESTKKDNIDYIIIFNKAMYQFFEKHYSYSYTLLFRLVILSGIVIRGVLGYLKTLLKRLWNPMVDLVILNLLVFTAFLIRYNIQPENLFNEYKPRYLVYNIIIAILYIIAGKYYDLYGTKRHSAAAVLKATLFAIIGTAVITYFLREYAFSRWILVSAALSGAIILSSMRLLRKNLKRNQPFSTGQFQPTRILIVGLNDKTAELIRKIRTRVDWNYHIAGIVQTDSNDELVEIEGVPVVGKLSQISSISTYHQAGQIFFLVDAVSHEKVLQVMSQLQERNIIFKIVPNTLDYIIGKSNVEYLDNIPLVDVQLLYYSTWNQFAKRNLDLLLAIPLFLILLPILGIPWIFLNRKREIHKFYRDEQNYFTLRLLPKTYPAWMNILSTLGYVISGELSMVGAPLIADQHQSMLYYKYGITGLRQQRGSSLANQKEAEQIDLHYLQSYSIWLDLDILAKSVIRPRKTAS
jgi:GT2 family glycosyltransferase/lipopolysaccharide/colanic/teichoic acid biosynthesis glycosyltransferase